MTKKSCEIQNIGKDNSFNGEFICVYTTRFDNISEYITSELFLLKYFFIFSVNFRLNMRKDTYKAFEASLK